MQYILSILILVTSFSFLNAQEDKKVATLVQEFETGYQPLFIRSMQIAYVDNLGEIRSLKRLKKQADFFTRIQKKLAAINPKELSSNSRLDFDILSYQTSLHLERIEAEKGYKKNAPDSINHLGLFHQPNGKALYSYYLKNWIDASVTPDQMFEFGKGQVAQVSAQMLAIQQQLGLDSVAFYEHLDAPALRFEGPEEIPTAMEATKKAVLEGTSALFRDYDLPDVAIAKGTSEFLKNAPGYYNPPAQTLYYNLTKEMEYPRNTGWLFIHEGVPGHHFQSCLERKFPQTSAQQLFYSYCYKEGWAAYCEELGKDLGGYPTVYDELGKLEWDIIRSVRVVLDVALNYYGWSDEKALAYWQQYIPNKDAVARREIARMKRWPCQVITYKYGSQKILTWKNRIQLKQKEAFDIKTFHHQILSSGPLPMSILEERIYAFYGLASL